MRGPLGWLVMGIALLFYGRKIESTDVQELIEYCRESGVEVITCGRDPA
ncbi:MAG: hypothetical protein QXS68_04090 [Candidatus Methanomethylicaceae archaeon]